MCDRRQPLPVNPDGEMPSVRRLDPRGSIIACDGIRCCLGSRSARNGLTWTTARRDSKLREPASRTSGRHTIYEKCFRLDRLRPLAASSLATGASAQATLDQRQAEGLPDLRLEHRPRRLRPARRPGQLDRPRRRLSAAPSPPRSSTIRPRSASSRSSAKDRFTALQSGEVDVLSRNTTWTMSRDTQLGLDFPAINYYRRPGLHGPQEARRHLGQGAERRLGLHAAGHDDRAEPRRLLPRQQHEV